MTLEIRRIRYRTGSQGRVNAAYEAALPARAALSPLGGFFNVEIGPLNSAIELFWYPDEAERLRVGALASALGTWPIDTPDVLEISEPMVLEDAPFNPPFAPGSFGAVYELRTYEIERGGLDAVIQAWAEGFAARAALSPILGAWSRPGDDVDHWVHLWAYEDAAARQRVRAAAIASGVWPPRTAVLPLRQDNELVLPTSFSPLR